MLAVALPAPAAADQASQPGSTQAAALDAGAFHTCALLGDGRVRCWGYAGNGQLGYGDTNDIGDDETPGSAGPVDLGGHAATAISAGDYHTCALMDDGTVRCWGYGGDGRLGYGNTRNVGDQQTPASAGPVYLGAGRTAKAISAGGAHTCAILENGKVLCWGYGALGQLGYGDTSNVGDQLRPGDVGDASGPVYLGTGRTAIAISAGAAHTCAILDNGDVLCWGFGGFGRLGYGNVTNGGTNNIGDNETPGSMGKVDIGTGRTAVAISAGSSQTCVVLDHGDVRCWGSDGLGQLGYGSTDNVGATQTPGSVPTVNIGAGRTAVAVAAGQIHTCAVLDHGDVRCWGFGNNGRLGYGNTTTVGDLQTPASAGPVDLGAGRTAVAITAGQSHTCARLDNGTVRCWGAGAYGRLGYCNQADVGAAQTAGAAGPVNLQPGDGGVRCPPPVAVPILAAGVGPATPSVRAAPAVDPLAVEAQRLGGLRDCLARVSGRTKRARRRARGDCLRRFGRTPGRVVGLRARASSRTKVTLTFSAPGSDGSSPPAAHSYTVKQSSRRIAGTRDFARAQTLCHGACRFPVTAVGTGVELTVTHLLAHKTYYYAIAARDNVSGRLGPPSAAVRVRTR